MSYTKHTWYTGETITANLMNHIEDGIYQLSVQPTPSSSTYLQQTLTAGQTSVTFTSSLLTNNALVDVFTDKAGLSYVDMTAGTGSVTVTFEAQSENVTVTLEIKSMS